MQSKNALIVAIIGVALAASLGTYAAIKFAPQTPQSAPQQPSPPPQVLAIPHTHVGVLFQNKRYTLHDNFPDNEIKLYDFDSGATTIIKEYKDDFQTDKTLEGWTMPNGQPITLIDAHDVDASHTKLSVFEPSIGQIQRVIERSDIVSPYVSMAFLPSRKLVSYCGTEGEYIIENIETGIRTMPNNNMPLCQVAYNASQPHFSANGSAIYFNDLPVPETGAEKNYLIYKKLDLETGVISDVSSLANTFHNYPNSSMMNPEHSLFLETLQNGFRVRDIHTLDIEHSETTEIDTMPIVTEVVLVPPGANVTIGKGVFTQDGKGLFYYTLIGSSDPSNVNNEPTRFALGYLDLQTYTNTYPISLPDSDNQDAQLFQGVQTFDAFDNNSLLYAVTRVPFRATSRGDLTTRSQGVSKLYAVSSSGVAHLIDTSSYLFETISFVVMH